MWTCVSVSPYLLSIPCTFRTQTWLRAVAATRLERLRSLIHTNVGAFDFRPCTVNAEGPPAKESTALRSIPLSWDTPAPVSVM